MANIFHSKEVYKKVPGINPEDNPLRAVRGVYITGQHRDPSYNDELLHVVSISTSIATVADFTQVSVSIQDDPVINITDIDTNTLSITEYTKSSDTIQNDPVINITDIDTNTLSITAYSKVASSIQDDPVINITDIDTNTLSITAYSKTSIDGCDSLIKIYNISSTQATISNI